MSSCDLVCSPKFPCLTLTHSMPAGVLPQLTGHLHGTDSGAAHRAKISHPGPGSRQVVVGTEPAETDSLRALLIVCEM